MELVEVVGNNPVSRMNLVKCKLFIYTSFILCALCMQQIILFVLSRRFIIISLYLYLNVTSARNLQT